MAEVFAMFGLGPMEIAIVGLIVLLLFGNRLPTAMRSLGRGMLEFRKGIQGVDEETEESKRLDSPTKP